MERGKIYNKTLYKQATDYSGLRYNKITPTDIDGSMDFETRAYVFFDLKREGGKLTLGQEIHYKGLVDNLRCPAMFVEVENNTRSDETVYAADCPVIRYYRGKDWGEWYTPEKSITLKKCIDAWLSQNGLDKYLCTP